MIEQELFELAKSLRISALKSHWDDINKDQAFREHISRFMLMEKEERTNLRLNRCIRQTGLKRIEPLAEFDWNWPTKIDEQQIRELFELDFLTEKANIVFIGPNSVGKTMIMKNLVHAVACNGMSSLFVEAAEMLHDLVHQPVRSSLEQVLTKYLKPRFLGIDEIGYLSYDSRHADLLFQVVHRRARDGSSTAITTNRAFKEWGEVFPNSASVTALVDRLVERCDIVEIDGPSYRDKRYHDRQVEKSKQRKAKASKKSKS